MTSGNQLVPAPQLGSSRRTSSSARQQLHLDAICNALQRAFSPASLDAASAREIALVAVPFRVAPKGYIFRSGTLGDALWLLGSGNATVGRVEPNGRWLQSRAVAAGEWLDITTAWLGGPYPESAVATNEVLAYELPVARVESVCRRKPEIARQLLTCVSARALRATEGARDLVAKDVTARLAGWLLQSLNAENTASEVVLHQRKWSLASELGTSPETFSRTLRRLRELGVIEIDRYRIRVRDLAGLMSLVSKTSRQRTRGTAA